MSRDDLELLALERVSAADYYELLDALEETSVDELMAIIEGGSV